MDNLLGAPLVRSGNEDNDLYLNIAFCTGLALVSSHVLYTVGHAWFRSEVRRNSRRAEVNNRRRQVYLLWALSLIALLVVNGLRLDFRRLKTLQVWKEAVKTFKDLRNEAERHVAKGRQPARTPDGLPLRLEEFSFALYKDWMQKTGLAARDALYALRSRLPWFEQDMRSVDTVWDYFKMLVVNPVRFWWTQQWFTGWAAWAIFVSIECHQRDLPFTTAMSFVLLAYLAGLAAVQALFYTLLLLKSARVRPRTTWNMQPALGVIAFVGETIGVLLLPRLLYQTLETKQYKPFHGLQAFVILAPVLYALLFNAWPKTLTNQRTASLRANKARNSLWLVISISAAFANWHSAIEAFKMMNDGHARWYLSTILQRKSCSISVDKVTCALRSIGGSLGDNQWINAVAFDVLLSCLSLGIWSYVSSANVEALQNSSILFWLPKAKTAAEKAVERARDTAEDLYEEARSYSPLKVPRSRAAHWNSEDEDDEAYQTAYRSRGRSSSNARKRTVSTSAVPTSGSRSRSRSQARRVSSPVKRSLSSRRSSSRGRTSAAEHDTRHILGPTAHAVAAEAEPAALTLGLAIVGGLGTASAAVFGAGQAA